MPCGCGRSYIVNEDHGFYNRRKKDSSFKSFITFLLVVLLLLIVIYCILVTVTRKKGENRQPSHDFNEKLHGQIGRATTENPKNSNGNSRSKFSSLSTVSHDYMEAQSESPKMLQNNYFEEVTETQDVTTVANKVTKMLRNKFEEVTETQDVTTVANGVTKMLRNKFEEVTETQNVTTVANEVTKMLRNQFEEVTETQNVTTVANEVTKMLRNKFEEVTETQNVTTVANEVTNMLRNKFEEARETQNVTTVANEVTPTVAMVNNQLTTSNSALEKENPNIVTTETNDYKSVPESSIKPGSVFVGTDIFETTTKKSLLVTDMYAITELNDISQKRVAGSQDEFVNKSAITTTQDVKENVIDDAIINITDQNIVVAMTEQSYDEVLLENHVEKTTTQPNLNQDFIKDNTEVATTNSDILSSAETNINSFTEKTLEETKLWVPDSSTEPINDIKVFKKNTIQGYEFITTNNPFAETTLSSHNSTEINLKKYFVNHVNEAETATQSKIKYEREKYDFKTTTETLVKTSEHVENATTANLVWFRPNTTVKSEQTILPYYSSENYRNIAVTTTSRHVFDQTTNEVKNSFKKEFEVIASQSTVPKRSEDNSKIIKKENICTSPVCKKRSSQILQLIDHSVDPCDDFYQFSCGGIKDAQQDSRNLEYLDDLLKHIFTFSNPKDKYLKSLQKFFGTCMKYENDDGYSTRIQQVFTSNVRDNNLTSLLAFLMLRQSTPLFEVRYGFVGGKEGYGMQILPPDSNYETSGLRDWSLQSQIRKRCLNFNPKLKYQSQVNLTDVYKDYTSCEEKTFKKMAENLIMEKPEITKVLKNKILQDFLNFFSKMNKISGPILQNAILYEKYTKTYIEDLNKKYEQIDWQDFFNKIAGKSFDSSTPIFLYMEDEYFEPVMDDLEVRMIRSEKDVIETLKLYYQLQLYQNLLAPRENKEQFCMDQAIQLMPEITTKIFYEISGLPAFPHSSLENVFQELKDKFYWLIEMSQLEEANKKEYKNGLDKLTLKLFKNDKEWVHYLGESYSSSYITDDHPSNVFMFIENKRKRSYSLRSGDEDFVFTQFVDSQFSGVPQAIQNTNIIVIPNTFLTRLTEAQGYPTYIFEAYLKFHLSRALALHLNDIDQRVKSPFYKQFLNSLNSYLENEGEKKMLRGQQLSYKSGSTFWQQVVQFSNPSRMADNIALDMAFNEVYTSNNVYKSLPYIPSDYPPEHQFFLLIAQEYCQNPTVPALAQSLYETPNIPSTFRIDSMIMNSEAFSATFQCPQGTPMNPEIKTQFETFIASDNNYYEYEQANK